MTLFLSFRYQPVGGPIRKNPEAWISDAAFRLKKVDIDTLAATLAGRDVVFGLHGYNNSQSDAVNKLTRLESILALPANAIVVGVLWPGDSRSLGALSYPFEKPTADACGRYLAAFCNSRLADVGSISFVSHSLGARVTLETIRRLDARAKLACLMAAAIERTCLEKEYADAFAKVETLCVLASHKDKVLRLAFPLGNLVGHIIDPTANPLSDALGYDGPPRPIGNTKRPWLIADSPPYDHGDYLPPSDATVPFPVPGKWQATAGYVSRAVRLESQTWPV